MYKDILIVGPKGLNVGRMADVLHRLLFSLIVGIVSKETAAASVKLG